jgi:radical SAM superfamily enzyme YgiQ (UPF0313 family)
LRLGTLVARRVRALNARAHVSFFGLYAALNAPYLLSAGAGDSAIAGEFGTPLLALARTLDQAVDPRHVEPPLPGVALPGRSPASLLTRFEGPVPDRVGLPPLRTYAGLERDGEIIPAGYVEATRGCHHTCRHCPITPVYRGRFTVVPREVVLADARAQIAAGAHHLTFGDPDFFNGPGHSLRICRALHAEFPWLTFDATIKIEHLLQHRRVLPELARLGCLFVVSAVESLSDQVLTRLAKGHSRADVEAALAELDRVGIALRPSLLPFTPWTTLDDYLELLRFVAANDLQEHVDPIHFAIRLLIPPGSAVLDDPAGTPWLGPLDAEHFTYRWSHPDARLDRLQEKVARLVEGAAARREPTRATFAAIWQAAHFAADRPLPPLPLPPVRRARPPRLTEDWFC